MLDVKKINSEEFLELIKEVNDHQIVDVNEEPLDFDLSSNVLHIPFSKLEAQQSKLSKDMPIVLICKFGEKCFFGAALLMNNFGFRNVMSLTGGMEALNELIEERKEKR